MVRYSKLAFRQLVRRYGVDLAFTPMIMADAFVASKRARDADLSTCASDRPLVVQFAGHQPELLAQAAAMVASFADGVDLNCGCPQRWAVAQGWFAFCKSAFFLATQCRVSVLFDLILLGVGCALLSRPELVADIVRQIRSRVICSDFSVSLKIRLLEDEPAATLELGRRAVAAGADWVTVHGRTPRQRHEPIDVAAVAELAARLPCPVVANGDVRTLEDARRLAQSTGAQGVMAARGLLRNPALFCADCEVAAPLRVVKDWVQIATDTGTPFSTYHYHLMQMLAPLTLRPERLLFNSLNSFSATVDFLEERFQLSSVTGATHQ